MDDHYYKGNLTFDQFVLGITLAACAYLAQTTTFGVLGWNLQTLQLGILVLLGIAAWLGFKRIESTIHLLKTNARYLELCHRYGADNLKEAFRKVEECGETTGFYYRWRNRAMFLGFALHVAVKVLAAYPVFS